MSRRSPTAYLARPALGLLVLAAIVAAVLAPGSTGTVHAATFTVDENTVDGPDLAPGNGVCLTAAGKCTLRAAIQEANAFAGNDIINFALGTGTPTISPTSPLPTITQPVFIDGNTGGASRVEINGAGAGATDGFTISAGSSTLRFLVINNFNGDGVTLQTLGDNFVTDSAFGIDTDGVTVQANTGNGVVIQDSPSNDIARNLISGNGSNGVLVFGAGSTGNGIYTNIIGLDAGGTLDRGNAVDGVRTSPGISGNPATTVIGGPDPTWRNIISGNESHGINLVGDSNTIWANYIGTDITGTVMLANGNGGFNDYGILIADDSNTIGASVQSAPGVYASANTIVGASSAGIRIGPNGNNNQIYRNYIGATVGAVAMPNQIGIEISGSSNTLGGGTGLPGPVVAGNTRSGVIVGGNNNEIYASFIGLMVPGGVPMPNGRPLPILNEAGIYVSAGTGTIIGRANTQPTTTFNTIQNNRGGGIAVHPAASGVQIRGNNLSNNLGMEIDLYGSGPISGLGPTPNDLGDADVGGNNQQNYPIITSAITTSPGNTIISANLNSTASTPFTIRAYRATPACDPTVHGAGFDFGVDTNVVTDPSGNVSFSWPGAFQFLAGDFVSLTATNDFTGDTSEFSPCAVVAASCPSDNDCDGFLNPAPAGHTGPANTNVALDNCSVLANGGVSQPNKDGNYIDNSPPYAPATDDKTLAYSDGLGDTCDSDDDNDGVIDAYEVESIWCSFGTAITDPQKADTDGDRVLDGIECLLGFNPNSAASFPTLAQCGANVDPDLDKISTRLEVCYYNTNPNSNDTDGDAVGGLDGDGARDGCEVASLNGDQEVSSGDQGMLGAAVVGTQPYTVNVDINKDGMINSGDQGLMASFIVPPGQCP